MSAWSRGVGVVWTLLDEEELGAGDEGVGDVGDGVGAAVG